MNKLRYLASVAIALVIGFAGLAAAQNYPARPITIIVPFAAGGGNDILARLLGQHMGRALGQNFVIENRAGAAGTIGARAVAKAPPDGYALMVGHSGVFGVAPALYGANAGHDPRKDFSPVGLIASFTQILVVHPTLPVHTVKDVIHYGMVAPAGVPRAIVARLNAELNAALLAADVRARIADEGGDALPGTPEQQAADIDAEETKWGALVRSLGLKAE